MENTRKTREKVIFTFRKVALLTLSRLMMSLFLRDAEMGRLFMDARVESESRSLSSLKTLFLLLLLLPTIFK